MVGLMVMLEWLANVILWMLGDDPTQYYSEDKWPSVTGILSYYIIPYGQIILFFLPFLVVWIIWRKFTATRIIVAVIIGLLLAIIAYGVDWAIVNLGQAAVFYGIYGP